MLSKDKHIHLAFRKWVARKNIVGRRKTFESAAANVPEEVKENLDDLSLRQMGRDKPPVIISSRNSSCLFLKLNEVKLSGNRPVRFENCFIRELKILGDATVRATFKNCFIFKLSFGKGRFEDLEMLQCALFNIDGEAYTAPNSNAFPGRVTIIDLWLPRTKDQIFRDHEPEGESAKRRKLIYEFRNVRSYLSKKGDMDAAGQFHAAELSLERKDENCFIAFLSWAYETISNFGNSPGKALAAFAAILVFIGAFNLSVSGIWGQDSILVSSCNLEDTTSKDLTGWQAQLCAKQLLRHAVYPLYLTFNPLGVFISKPLIMSADWKIAGANSFFGILATIAFALFVLAVRRKFRLERSD